MIPKPNISRRQLAAVLLVLVVLVLAGGAAAYTTLFTAGAGTSYETASGLEVSTTIDQDLSEQNPFVDDNTVVLEDTNFSANGSASLTVDQFSGTTTDLSSIDASTNAITVNPSDKSAITVDGDVTELSFEDARLDATSQITYSANGAGTLTVTGLPASTDFAARTTSGTLLTSATTTSSGSAEIPVEAATDEGIVLLAPDAITTQRVQRMMRQQRPRKSNCRSTSPTRTSGTHRTHLRQSSTSTESSAIRSR